MDKLIVCASFLALFLVACGGEIDTGSEPVSEPTSPPQYATDPDGGSSQPEPDAGPEYAKFGQPCDGTTIRCTGNFVRTDYGYCSFQSCSSCNQSDMFPWLKGTKTGYCLSSTWLGGVCGYTCKEEDFYGKSETWPCPIGLACKYKHGPYSASGSIKYLWFCINPTYPVPSPTS